MNEFSTVLKQFAPIGLPEMKTVELMNRVDTKFIFHKNQLSILLNQLNSHYRVLEIGSGRISTYKNLYFDTKNLKFYRDHHNGKMNRMKIRMRKYMETNVCYVELKQKNNKGRTKKARQRIPDFEPQLSLSTEQFLNQYAVNVASLQPVLWNEFKRATLVNLENRERITIDMGLSFDTDGKSFGHENLIIVELKQVGLNRNSALFNILKAMQVNPYRISKYCVGMATMYADIKKNAFKEKVLRINKITR